MIRLWQVGFAQADGSLDCQAVPQTASIAVMIVTHTQNADGQRRVYLGGKSSLECWVEPKADGCGWSFHVDEAVTGNRLEDDDKRTWAVHMLLQLAEAIGVPPAELATVPFEAIAALHATDPFAGRRVATPRRKAIEQGFMSTAPGITRPRADFAARDRDGRQRGGGKQDYVGGALLLYTSGHWLAPL